MIALLSMKFIATALDATHPNGTKRSPDEPANARAGAPRYPCGLQHNARLDARRPNVHCRVCGPGSIRPQRPGQAAFRQAASPVKLAPYSFSVGTRRVGSVRGDSALVRVGEPVQSVAKPSSTKRRRASGLGRPRRCCCRSICRRGTQLQSCGSRGAQPSLVQIARYQRHGGFDFPSGAGGGRDASGGGRGRRCEGARRRTPPFLIDAATSPTPAPRYR
jgi:hypothetical protein